MHFFYSAHALLVESKVQTQGAVLIGFNFLHDFRRYAGQCMYYMDKVFLMLRALILPLVWKLTHIWPPPGALLMAGVWRWKHLSVVLLHTALTSSSCQEVTEDDKAWCCPFSSHHFKSQYTKKWSYDSKVCAAFCSFTSSVILHLAGDGCAPGWLRNSFTF